MDLYRLSGHERDLLPLNLEHVFGNDVALIEWPQRLGSLIPLDRLEVTLSIVDERDSRMDEYNQEESVPRRVILTPIGKGWETRLRLIQKEGYMDDWLVGDE